MQTRRALLLLALLALACGANAFSFASFFKGKKAEPAAKPAAEPAEVAPAPASDTTGNAVFWYNEVTGESSWELPTYELKNEEGVTYYVDPVTKEASWEKPAALQWRAAADEQGRTYYFNEATTATQWEVPAVLAWKQMAAADKSEL